ncbi:MAG: AraC family transcriptional regulator [bacterium]|nr:AraC family transcriptional regulator [bacterium]
MEHYFDIASVISFFGTGLCVLMALEQLTGKKRDRANYFCAILLMCNGVIILGSVLLSRGIVFTHPISIFFFITALWLIGPVDYIYFYSLVYPEFRISLKMKLQFIPAGIVFIAEIICHGFPEHTMHTWLKKALADPLSLWFAPFIFMAAVLVLLYLLYLLKNILLAWGEEQIKEEVRVIVAANGLAIFTVLLLAGGFLFSNKYLLVTGGLSLAVIHMGIFLAHSRSPGFFRLLKREIRNKRYRKSLIKGLNTDLVNDHLALLMTEEFLYRDCDLSLPLTAERLSISPHQLSQYLNEKHAMSFPNFINSFRVEEAKKLLLENPEQSVISICFQVGFSSKSAFNSAFRKFTGKSPVELRDAHSS